MRQHQQRLPSFPSGRTQCVQSVKHIVNPEEKVVRVAVSASAALYKPGYSKTKCREGKPGTGWPLGDEIRC